MIEILNFMKERKKESKNQSSVFSFRDKTLESIETSEMKIYKGVFQFFFSIQNQISNNNLGNNNSFSRAPSTREDPSLSIMNLQIFLSHGSHQS